jgi:quinoprotein dehydrogenase-associated probable ABC transporter substrate-binding protein
MKQIPLAALCLVGSLATCHTATALERKEYSLSTPYDELTPSDIADAKLAAKRRKIDTLSVCADPGNMPLSDKGREGFQNKIIETVAGAMGAEVRYFWRPYLERGLTRETFANNECDVLLDMPADSRSVLTSLPIYRSTYVLAYKSDRNYDFKSLDDPRLKELKVGTYQHSAIRIALAKYGLKNLESVKTVTSDADLEPENQPWRQAQDVLDGKLDVVGIWGPFAGWLKTMKHEPITLQPVNLMEDEVPLEFSLAIGVQNTDVVLKFMLDNALRIKKDEIATILQDYGVALVQCSDCIVPGDLPSHGSYDKSVAKKYEDRFLKSAPAALATAAAAPDQVVSQKRVEDWLAEGADINAELNNAVLAFDKERVTFLLGRGADVNKLDDQGYTPLLTAVRNRNSDMAELLLEHGADPNLPDSDGATPLVHAINRNHVPSVELLVAKGADIGRVGREGYTPLEFAIGDDKLFAAQALLDAGALVNTANGEQKITPLMLIASKLSPQARTTHLASGPTPIEIATELIARDADVNAQSASGVTPLMIAAGNNNAPMIGLLLSKGANPEIKNHLGKTALDIAREASNKVAVSALELLAAPAPN